MGGNTGEALSAHVTEGGPGMGAGVPVMHPWEMFHIKLGHLEKLDRVAKQETKARDSWLSAMCMP